MMDVEPSIGSSSSTPCSSSSPGKRTASSGSPFASNGMNKTSSKPGTTKKLVIKNFEKPKLPEDYLEQTWSQLKEAVVAVQTSRPVSTPLEELYQAVENLCCQKMASKLYTNLESLCISHVKTNMTRFKDTMDNNTFLRTIDGCWQNHCRQMVSPSSLYHGLSDRIVYSVTDPDSEHISVFGQNVCPTKCLNLFHLGHESPSVQRTCRVSSKDSSESC